MPGKTSIEWTMGDDGSAGVSWNPVTGCTKVSAGCLHCYAETFAERFRGVPGHPYEQGFDLKLWPDRLTVPIHWVKPRRVFVNSMSDLWHAGVPTPFVASVFAIMGLASWHRFLVLTKRPQRMARLTNDLAFVDLVRQRARDSADQLAAAGALRGERLATADPGFAWPPPNVWLGTSIEDNAVAWRADVLRRTAAAIRFLSCEPLIGPLDRLDLAGVDWVIAGAESGHGARPMDLNWARDLRDRCGAAGIAFFLKQTAENGRKIGLPELDGRRWVEFPASPPPRPGHGQLPLAALGTEGR